MGRGSKIGYFRMHREILGLSPGDGLEVDYINGDGLDNRRENLRNCTRRQNNRNARPRGGSSRYKGVCWDKHCEKWFAYIRVEWDLKRLRYFALEEEAARAHDAAAVEHLGEFARPNSPAVAS